MTNIITPVPVKFVESRLTLAKKLVSILKKDACAHPKYNDYVLYENSNRKETMYVAVTSNTVVTSHNTNDKEKNTIRVGDVTLPLTYKQYIALCDGGEEVIPHNTANLTASCHIVSKVKFPLTFNLAKFLTSLRLTLPKNEVYGACLNARSDD